MNQGNMHLERWMKVRKGSSSMPCEQWMRLPWCNSKENCPQKWARFAQCECTYNWLPFSAFKSLTSTDVLEKPARNIAFIALDKEKPTKTFPASKWLGSLFLCTPKLSVIFWKNFQRLISRPWVVYSRVVSSVAHSQMLHSTDINRWWNAESISYCACGALQ